MFSNLAEEIESILYLQYSKDDFFFQIQPSNLDNKLDKILISGLVYIDPLFTQLKK